MTISSSSLSGLLLFIALCIATPLNAQVRSQPTSRPTSAPADCPIRPVVTATLTKSPATGAYYEMTPPGTPLITIMVVGQPVGQPDNAVQLRDMAFITKGLNGEPIRVPDDFRGKLIVVHFWASWCAACTREEPYWVAANQAFKDRGVAFVGIPVDKNRALSLDGVRTKAARAGMTWTQAFEDAPTLSMNFHIKSLPAVFVLEGDSGRVLAQGMSIRGENLAKTLDALLGQKKPLTTAPLIGLTDIPKQSAVSGSVPRPDELEQLNVLGKRKTP